MTGRSNDIHTNRCEVRTGARDGRSPGLSVSLRWLCLRLSIAGLVIGLAVQFALPVLSPTDTVLAQDQNTPTVVPIGWPLIPAGLGQGEQFRLLAKTKNPLASSTSTNIADYNDYVQYQVRNRGHLSIQGYADEFMVLGSTAAVNARTNTGTTGSGGVPIYWLNGAKVADSYDDFYDGTWSNKYTGRGVAGDLIEGSRASGRQLLCTGTADDGTTTNLPLGGGDPDGDGTSECTATSIAITSSTLGGDVVNVAGRARYLALSNVFEVGDATVATIEDVSITSDAGSDREYEDGDDIQITATFSEAVTVTGTPRMRFRVDHYNGRRLVERNRKALYDADASTSTKLCVHVHGKVKRLRQGRDTGEEGQPAPQWRSDQEHVGRY